MNVAGPHSHRHTFSRYEEHANGVTLHFKEGTTYEADLLIGADGTDTDHNLFRWVVKWRDPLKQWSKGRVTIMGDAAHPTSQSLLRAIMESA